MRNCVERSQVIQNLASRIYQKLTLLYWHGQRSKLTSPLATFLELLRCASIQSRGFDNRIRILSMAQVAVDNAGGLRPLEGALPSSHASTLPIFLLHTWTQVLGSTSTNPAKPHSCTFSLETNKFKGKLVIWITITKSRTVFATNEIIQ